MESIATMATVHRTHVCMRIAIDDINWCAISGCGTFYNGISIIMSATNNNRNFSGSNNYFNYGGNSLIYFAGIDNARFKKQVVPGDQLILEAEVIRVIRGVGKFRTRATVDGELACEAELIAAIRERPVA